MIILCPLSIIYIWSLKVEDWFLTWPAAFKSLNSVDSGCIWDLLLDPHPFGYSGYDTICLIGNPSSLTCYFGRWIMVLFFIPEGEELAPSWPCNQNTHTFSSSGWTCCFIWNIFHPYSHEYLTHFMKMAESFYLRSLSILFSIQCVVECPRMQNKEAEDLLVNQDIR